MRAVRRTKQRSARGTCRIHQPLKLQTRHHIGTLRVGKLVKLRKIDGLKACCGDDRAVLALDDLVFLLVVNGACRADLRAHAALAVFEHIAGVWVNRRDLRHRLSKGYVDCAPGIESQVKLVRHLLLRAFFRTCPTAGADIFFYKARLAADFHMEISDKAAHVLNLGIGIDVDFIILRAVDHFGRQDTRRTIERREGLVDLGHFAADGWLLLDNVDLEACLGDIERRLDARDAAADDQRALCHRAAACG